MAKKGGTRGGGGGGAESNTGLVVSLVIFILLTIGLGVTTFFGYSGQEELRKAAKDADTKASNADKKARAEEAQKLALRIALGISDAADKTAFSGIKTSAGEPLNSQVAKINDNQTALFRALAGDKVLAGIITAKLDDLAKSKWDVAGNDVPPKTYLGLIDDLHKAFQGLTGRMQANAIAFDEEKGRLVTQIQELEGKLQKAQADVVDANKKVLDEEARKAEGSDRTSAEVKRLSDQLAKLTVEKDNLEASKDASIKKLNNQIESMNKVRENLRARIGPILEKLERVKLERPELRELGELHELLLKQFEAVQSLSNDTPKGSIIKMDRVNGLAYINLGTADYIRPGVTFSVLPAGSTGRAAASHERKGAIEVVEVLEAHLSTAKVIEATNAVRDPLLPGDLLFNPAWNSSQREHVAIAGIIDLNGDGIDDTQDLIRALERQGVVVDAYLDLKERTVKGAGISEKTTYLILGETPKLPANPQIETDPISKAAIEVIGKMDEMKNKVRDLGGQQVTYRRFLSLVGFKLPKVTDAGDTSTASYLGTSSKAAPKPKDEKPK